MKKVTSVVVLLVLISTSVFAAPVTAVVENKQKEVVSEVDLFDTVQATELTGQEMKAVEGEGLFGAFVGAAVGAAVGTLLAPVTNYSQEYKTSLIIVTTAVGTVIGGAL